MAMGGSKTGGLREQPAKAAAGGIRHSYATIGLHWLSVLAVLLAAGSGLWREWTEVDSLRSTLLDIHKQAGLVVLVCLVLRLVVRFTFGMADTAGESSLLVRWAAQMAHAGLYLLLFALPVVGLFLCSASAIDVKVFGLASLPQLIEDDPDVAGNLADWHVWGAWAMLVMVVAHMGAALWHHFWRRDHVLRAMWPGLSASSSEREPIREGSEPEQGMAQQQQQRAA